jgi:hypothetical protein
MQTNLTRRYHCNLFEWLKEKQTNGKNNKKLVKTSFTIGKNQ